MCIRDRFLESRDLYYPGGTSWALTLEQNCSTVLRCNEGIEYELEFTAVDTFGATATM